MKKLISLILLVLLVGCAGQNITATPDTNTGFIKLKLVSMFMDEYNYKVVIEITNSSEFDNLIQEISLSDGTSLVECFQLRSGKITIDNHVDNTSRNRQMIVYPGIVNGVDWRGELFAHLPQNHNGSVVTNISEEFNRSYQQEYDTTGEIIVAAKNLGVKWSINCSQDELVVNIDGHLYTLIRAEFDG